MVKTLIRWFKLYILPVWILLSIIGLLAFKMWAVAAIGGIFLISSLLAQKDEYPFLGGTKPETSWRQQVVTAWISPTYLGISVAAGGLGLMIAAIAFGFTIGVTIGIGFGVVLAAFWLFTLVRRSRSSQS